MPKLDYERQKKANSIESDVRELLHTSPNHDDTLSLISSIICEVDTDIAITVMEQINTVESRHHATAIKVNYGY